MYDRTYYQGYFANKNGVLSFNGNQGYWNFQPNGYALKTNSLEDSINFVENWMPRFALNEDQWTYIGNTNGVSVFKTTSNYVHKYISLLESPDEGQLFFDDVDSTTFNEKTKDEFRHLRIGYIYQEYNLIRHLNVFDNIKLAFDLGSTLSKDKETKRIDKLMADFNITKCVPW